MAGLLISGAETPGSATRLQKVYTS